MLRIIIVCLLVGFLAHSAPHAVAAERYPARPIRVVVPFAPGGGSDLVARALAEKLGEALGGSIVIDNRSGAGGTLGTTLVAQAVPDGYTLLFGSASYVFAPLVYKDLPYDALKDFAPITMVARTPMILVVHPSLPARSTQELFALARKHPGQVLFASSGVGSNLHLNTALVAHKAGIKLTHVPYKGAGPAQIALMSGEVQMMMTGIQAAIPFVRSGRMRAIAVSTKERLPVVPDVPTLDESGVPGFDKAGWFALFARSGVPETVVTRLHQAAVKAVQNPSVVKQLEAEGSIVVGNSPAEAAAFVRAELLEWAKVIREMKLVL